MGIKNWADSEVVRTALRFIPEAAKAKAMSEQRYFWVLGATGYVGRAVVNHLLRTEPGAHIVAVGHWTLDTELMERTHFLMAPLDDFDFGWLDRFPPHTVVHCARMAGATPAARRRAARRGHRANVRWRTALESLKHPPKVVYCSGTLMYGNATDRITEDFPLNPIAYARAYEYAERPWREPGGKLDVCMAFPAWIFGKDSWFEHFFYRPALAAGAVPYYGDGSQQMSLVHLEDVAGKLVHVARHGTPGAHYNIFGLEPVSQREFAEAVARELNASTVQVAEPRVDKDVREALLSSMPVGTHHRTFFEGYHAQFTELQALVSAVVGGE